MGCTDGTQNTDSQYPYIAKISAAKIATVNITTAEIRQL